jgi:hypothetical protein
VADELPISYDKRELRSIITAFKAMDDEAVSQAKQESSALATYAANEIKAYSLTRTFGLTALQVSAFLVAVAHKNSGRVMNLDLIACVSSPEEHQAKVAETLATLSTQPFVRFSLN